MGEWSRAQIGAIREEVLAGRPRDGLAALLSDATGDPAPDIRLLDRLLLADRVFLVRPPDAPGLFFAGAAMSVSRPGPASTVRSFTGTGSSARTALARLTGEIAEFAARTAPHASPTPEVPDDAVVAAALAKDPALRAFRGRYAASTSGTVPAREITHANRVVPLPPWCFYAPRTTPAAGDPIGSGLAAAPDETVALVSSALELVERDATALWWHGGAAARPLAFHGAAKSEVDAYVSAIRAGRGSRHHRFLALAGGSGLPTVAAVSISDAGPDAAWGVATRCTATAAAKAAFREMCQIECGYRLIELKRQQAGDAALSTPDHEHLRTAAALAGAVRAGVLPAAAPVAVEATGDVADPLDHVRAAFDCLGLAWYALPLTAPEADLAVVKSLIPGLQSPDPSLTTERLERTLAETGGPPTALKGCKLT
jgi:ribosomal protein S12 methylthiotransferase accessory factor